MKKNTLDILEQELLSISEYVSEDGKVLKAKVYEDAMSLSPKLIKLLLENESLKKQFFKEVEGIVVFDKQQFAWLVESKEFLPDSYTHYKNKIGLTDENDDFISSKNDVVLSFPYKDCVLVGGQDKDEQKRDEIFFNEIVASEQITRMLAPKVLTNAKRYTVEGVEEDIEFQEDDNLIIKGNNLIALSSLLERYEGKVKCIYIDPPYYFKKNKGHDTFKYNSNFHLSTWLIFMENRLKLAKKMLCAGGTIWISISEDGMHYLKVLCDTIFGVDKFVGTLPRRTRTGKSDVPFNLSQDFDWMLVYTNVDEKENVVGRSVERNYYVSDDFPGQPWRIADLTSQQSAEKRPNSYFTMIDPKTGKEYPASKKRTWAVTKDTFDYYYQSGYIVFPDDYEFLNISKPYSRKFKADDDNNSKKSAVISDFLMKDFLEDILTNCKNKKGNDEIDTLFSRDEFDYAKPENLIKAILEVTTSENDLVLDFHLGSGTTAAVAHKMGRRYIGIEQMDYIENVTIERLKKVIDGEQGGISKGVDWQGGGSFVYCELLENSMELIKTIEKATDASIEKIKEMIYADDRIIPYITTDELIKSNDIFNTLDLAEKKKALISVVDKNKLYVNYSDMDDENYKVNECDKKVTNSFYKGW